MTCHFDTPGDEALVQFQVRKAVAGAAALVFDLEMPGASCVTDLTEALARAPSVVCRGSAPVLNRSFQVTPSPFSARTQKMSEVQIVSRFQIVYAVDETATSQVFCENSSILGCRDGLWSSWQYPLTIWLRSASLPSGLVPAVRYNRFHP